MNNYWKAILGLSLLSAGLITYIIVGKIGPGNGTNSGEIPLRDSINLLKKERVGYQRKVDSLDRSNDSLIMLKTFIKTVYRDKTHFVYTANPNQLDSLIREIAGIK